MINQLQHHNPCKASNGNGKATNGRKIPNHWSETSKETVGSGKQEIETDMKDPLIDTSSKESESDRKRHEFQYRTSNRTKKKS